MNTLIREAKYVLRRWPRWLRPIMIDDQTALVRTSHCSVYVDRSDGDIGARLLKRGYWEPDDVAVFTGFLRPGGAALDIGANHGVFALAAAKVVGPLGTVHAIEPIPRLADLVARSAQINGFDNITVHQNLVGNQTGEMPFYVHDNWLGTSTLSKAGGGAERVARMVRIDDLLPRTPLAAVKIDIEGHEGMALRGMTNLLAASPKVRILMEWCPRMMAGTPMPAEAVATLLQGWGFYPSSMYRGTVIPSSWADLMGSSRDLQNIVFERR